MLPFQAEFLMPTGDAEKAFNEIARSLKPKAEFCGECLSKN